MDGKPIRQILIYSDDRIYLQGLVDQLSCGNCLVLPMCTRFLDGSVYSEMMGHVPFPKFRLWIDKPCKLFWDSFKTVSCKKSPNKIEIIHKSDWVIIDYNSKKDSEKIR